MNKSLSRNTQFLIFSIIATSALTGCSQNTLDWRNAEINNGKIYAADSNDPFSGKVTNVPYMKIFLAQPTAIKMQIDLQKALLNFNSGSNSICDAQSSDGILDGDVVCKEPNSDITRIKASFKDGSLNGEYQTYTKDGEHVSFSANFKDGLADGKEEVFNEETQKKIYSAHWSQGKMDGELERWDPQSGDLIQDINYSNGKLDGDFMMTVAITQVNANPVFIKTPFPTKGVYKNGKFTGTRPYHHVADDSGGKDGWVAVKYVDGIIQNQADIDHLMSYREAFESCVDSKRQTRGLHDDEFMPECKAQLAQENINDPSDVQKVNSSNDDQGTILPAGDAADIKTLTDQISGNKNQGAPKESAAAVPQASSVEKRCGWIENDMPGGDLTLRDRDGTWKIVDADGRPQGFDKMPDTDKGDSCGCLDVTTDANLKRITKIMGGKLIPIQRCKADHSIQP